MLVRGVPTSKDKLLDVLRKRTLRGLNKHADVARGDRVAVALSGGPCSLSLCHILANAHINARPTVHSEALAIHVDTSALHDLWRPWWQPAHAVSSMRAMAASVLATGMPLVIVPIEALWVPSWLPTVLREPAELDAVAWGASSSDAADHSTRHAAAVAARALFTAAGSTTARDDLLAALTGWSIARAAYSLQYHRVMLGDCADRCAEGVILALSTGRGPDAHYCTAARDARAVPAHLLYATGRDTWADEERRGVLWLRPMRDWERHEAALYTRWHGLASLPAPRWSTGRPARDSLWAAAADLISRLQSMYGATVHNVVKTLDKTAAIGAEPVLPAVNLATQRERARARVRGNDEHEPVSRPPEPIAVVPAPGGASDCRCCALCSAVLAPVDTARIARSDLSTGVAALVCPGCAASLREYNWASRPASPASTALPLPIELVSQLAAFPPVMADAWAHALTVPEAESADSAALLSAPMTSAATAGRWDGAASASEANAAARAAVNACSRAELRSMLHGVLLEHSEDEADGELEET